MLRLPAELFADLGVIHRIAAVMPRPVLHMPDQGTPHHRGPVLNQRSKGVGMSDIMEYLLSGKFDPTNAAHVTEAKKHVQ